MIQIDPTVGAASVLALSAAAYVSVRRARRSRTVRRNEGLRADLAAFAADLEIAPVEVVPALRLEAAPVPLAVLDLHPAAPADAAPARPDAAAGEGVAPSVKVRKVAPAGKAKTPRPVAPVAIEASAPSALSAEQKAELLSLIETMQWGRALACVEGHVARGCDPSVLAAVAEAAALERLRALPEGEVRMALAGYHVLAALAPGNGVYADKVAQSEGALASRRATLLQRLTRDEDRWEPGTVWFNHPYNPAFDDVRLPIWLYVGQNAEGQTWLRLRTNWLGETRISVQGIEAIHDRMTETLTDGPYKIDADALGWEWRDEAASPYQIEVLRSLVAAEGVTLRYKGDPFAVEVELLPEEKRAVAEMIEVYDLMRIGAAVPQPALAA